MTYSARSNQIQYDEWFDENIDSVDLVYESEKKFTSSFHEKFFKMSTDNLIIVELEIGNDLVKASNCSNGLCPITDEELTKL